MMMYTTLTRVLAGMALLLMSAWPLPAAASSDSEMLRMAKEIPGFGGLFYDDTGAVAVYMLDTSRAPEVLTRADIRARGRRIRVVQGRYDFQDLYRWRNELKDVLAEPDVVWLDIDERRNRVVIGIDEKSATARTFSLVDSVRASTSAPREAVIVERVPAIHDLQTVQDRFRPVPGGVQIAFDLFNCTLGFNATRAGVVGFVTNSHCTTLQGVVSGTLYHQPAALDLIGIETVDPAFFSGGACPALRICRYSDSAFARYDAAALRELGRIARPVVPNQPPPFTFSLNIDVPFPRFTIVATAPFPTSGEAVNKVGRTTGWSRGLVRFTCINVNKLVNITMLCQDLVGTRSAGGDSGSPVFLASTARTDTNATLVGILWGGNDAGTEFVMSAWENITRASELGPLVVF